MAYRVWALGDFAAHRTIFELRRLHLPALGKLFGEVVRIAREASVGKMGTLAVDGLKVTAVASRHKEMSYKRMLQEGRKLRDRIAELTAESEAADASEDAERGPDVRCDELPAELQRREQRLEKILEARKQIGARQAVVDKTRRRSKYDDRKSPRRGGRFKRDLSVLEDKRLADRQSRGMKMTSGYDQRYNGQIAMDEDSQLIVATVLSSDAADNNELSPLRDEAVLNLGQSPEQILAYAGYRSVANFEALETRSIDAYLSLRREGIGTPQVATLPASKRMEEKLSRGASKRRYRRRRAIVEPVPGWKWGVLGFRRFSLRGKEKTGRKGDLVCLAINLKRFHVLRVAG